MADVCAVGPYLLQHVLGKGQTGIVKLGIHSATRKKVAVKIIDKSKIQPSVLAKVEREITIMKLIEHHNVLQLYDVYESKKNLFLILEYVGGGELFEYLVKKGRLPLSEAKHFFRQIVSAIQYCHEHLVCHRDLKPENLLLDEKKNIKIADFGMASVQVENDMLETSCGSPHYACPEVVRGIKYDGRKADSWSCGVILYALVVGCLPFDDDNLRVLLEKVKRGVYGIPAYVPVDCVDLIRRMITVDPEQRYSLAEVKKHPFFKKTAEDLPPEPPVTPVVQIKDLINEDELDDDVISSMTSLGCFRDREKLVKKLLMTQKNTEKVIYFLLLDRKKRKPAKKDDEECLFSQSPDAPQKRVDSPSASRRSTLIFDKNSSQMNQVQRRPRASTHQVVLNDQNGNRRPSSVMMNTPPDSPWRERFYTLTKNIFHKSGDIPTGDNGSHSPTQEFHSVKKSWFPGSLFHVESGELQPYEMVFADRTFVEVKADLIHSILTMQKVMHIPVSNTRFKLEYRSNKGKSWLRPNHTANSVTKLDVEITSFPGSKIVKGTIPKLKIIITFVSGSNRKFRKLCQIMHASIIRRGKHRSNGEASPHIDNFLVSTSRKSADFMEIGEEVQEDLSNGKDESGDSSFEPIEPLSNGSVSIIREEPRTTVL